MVRKFGILQMKFLNKAHRIKAFILHFLKVGRVDIKGIQSPYLYHFVFNITKNLFPYYKFEKVEYARKELIRNLSEMSGANAGNQLFMHYLSGIDIGNKEESTVGQTIFRIINDIQAKTVLEIGTFFGIDTLYIKQASPSAKCICIAENSEMAALARNIWKTQDETTISILAENHSADIKKKLKTLKNVDFVLFNATENIEQRLADFKGCLSAKHPGTVFVMKYIHNTPEMERIWKITRNHPEVSASIDLFSIGILLFRQDLGKKNYVVRLKNKHNEHLH